MSIGTILVTGGAALTNMLFCREGAAAVEFCPTDFHAPYRIVFATR